MVLTLLEAAALGWVLGHVAAALVRRRALRRGTPVDAFAWRVALVIGILFATVAAIEVVTQDKGVVLLVGLIVGSVVAGALWPVELGLKAPASPAEGPTDERREPAPPH